VYANVKKTVEPTTCREDNTILLPQDARDRFFLEREATGFMKKYFPTVWIAFGLEKVQ